MTTQKSQREGNTQMSRIGRKPIPVPAGVKISPVSGGKVEVQGPKGKLSVLVPAQIRLEQKDGVLNAIRDNEEHRALHGLARALLANAVQGVTLGFKKELDIVGVGYRAELKGKHVSFASASRTRSNFRSPRGFRSPSTSRHTWSSAARTRLKSARWRRISVRSARPTRTSRRVLASPVSA